MSRILVVLRFVGLLLAVQIGAIFITLWAHLGAALGLHPESVQLADVYAPGISLLTVSWFAARNRQTREGVLVALGTVVLWWIVFLFLMTRFLPEFFGDARPTFLHLRWWIFALCIGGMGGWLGARFPSHRVGAAFCIVMLLALWGLQKGQSIQARSSIPLEIQSDGTSILALDFKLRDIDFDLVDTDWDDSHPFDNRNTTWLGTPQNRVWQNLEARHRKRLLSLVNGSFFGAKTPYIAQHEAAIRHHGATYYPVSTLHEDWPQQAATLAWSRQGRLLKPQIVREAKPGRLKTFEGALGGVRVLIENGKGEILKPGMGGTTLKCSRTSVAWDGETFAILSVRDPDGEASSLRQNRREKNGEAHLQVGGWDVAQVQNYWKQRGFPNAVLFDGGESAQITFRLASGAVRSTQSSYHFTRTLGFMNGHPLRAVWPMWPPTMANGGVLNWFAVVEAG